MKTGKSLILILLALFMSGIVTAQDCDLYYMSEGTVFGYQNLDAKGNLSGSSRITCLGATNTGAGVNYRVRAEFIDSKGKNLTASEYNMRCDEGKFYVDMQNFLDPKSMESMKDMEVTAENKDMVYPATLTAGELLPDASVTVSASTGGMTILTMTVNVTNRKVVGNETVTVPAGTFDCVKITYDTETKLLFKVNTSVAEYICKGIGNVKSESFDKKGKLVGSTVLSELKK